MQISYSKCSTYSACSRYWFLSYCEKIRPIVENASLYFGSAIDSAVSALLQSNPDYLQIFKDRWDTAVKDGKPIKIFGSASIVYSNSDFDKQVLSSDDLRMLTVWAKELGLESLGTDGISIFKEVLSIKRNPYKRKLTADEFVFFGKCSWLSLFCKGKLLLEAFRTQFLPKITKVLEIQSHEKIDDVYTGDSLVGVVDMVVTLQDYGNTPVILDLKTSAQNYSDDQLELSDQLTAYKALTASKYPDAYTGYVVLVKNIPKESVFNCAKCGKLKDSKKRTCDNIINELRCSGEWKETKIPKPVVQVLIQKRTIEEVQDLLNDYSTIALAMKNNIHFKNSAKCANWYNNDCCYKKYCRHGDMAGLTKK
jgi:hypothetical protein